MKLFKDIVFGKYLDLDMDENDNHLLNYVLHHQRPDLSESIDSNLVFDIAGDTLLFGRSEFCLLTGFACGKVVFPEYIDDDIPPFLRRVFPDKAKKLENKASLGNAAQGKLEYKASLGKAARCKVVEGKAANGTAAKVKPAKHIVAQGLDIGIVPNSYHWWCKESEVMPRCLAWKRRKGFEKRNYPQLFGPDSNPITKLRPTLKELDENWCRKSYDYVVGFSVQVHN
ncbi:hypothetical protein Tco_0759593 [Tanacetum coccineum]